MSYFSPHSEIRLKCFLILQKLPKEALGEAIEELEYIQNYHTDQKLKNNLPITPIKVIKGKLKDVRVRPDIIFEP